MSRTGKIGITVSTFDLFHAGHVAMLEQAKQHCDWLIVGIQSDPTLDRKSKNKPVQSIVERQIQVRGCRFVDEVWVYDTEKDLEDLLNILPLDVRILGEEYRDKPFTGLKICRERGIDIVFNERRHDFSSSGLRKRVHDLETIKQKDAIEQ
jgi:glycerol-3-phosphate cytidylyltransferase